MAVAAVASLLFEEDVCSAVFGGDNPFIQPYCQLQGPNGPMRVCLACSQSNLVPGLAVSPNSASFSPLESFTCEARTLPQGSPLFAFGENIFTSRFGKEILVGETSVSFKSIMFEKASQQQSKTLPPESRNFLIRLQSSANHVKCYENKELQAQARAVIPLDTIAAYAEEVSHQGEWTGRDAYLKALMRWFKKDFFKWCNKPSCAFEDCGKGGGQQEGIGGGTPTAEEQSEGWASRVELYRCKGCGRVNRFPRFNNPGMLLRSRKGRCGEWANCFTLICRTMGYEARHISDSTDHVWTEVWSDNKGQWLHADPCENKLNKPKIYEVGWHKKLAYIFACSKDHVVDVLPRYTEKYHECLSRRTAGPEAWVKQQVATLNGQMFSSYATSTALDHSMNGSGVKSGVLPAVLRSRLIEEQNEFLLSKFCDDYHKMREISADEKAGRETGSVEWRSARGELGTQSNDKDDSSSSSSSPMVFFSPNLITSLSIEVTSVGYGDTIPKHFNGTKYSPRCICINGVGVAIGKRGHNLVALNLDCANTDNLIVGSECFDTWGDGNAGEKMASFIQDLPPGTVVLIAVIDSGENHLTNQSISALQDLVCDNKDVSCFVPSKRAAWALVGTKQPSSSSSSSSMSGWERIVSAHEIGVGPAIINLVLPLYSLDEERGTFVVDMMQGALCAEADCRLPEKYLPLISQINPPLSSSASSTSTNKEDSQSGAWEALIKSAIYKALISSSRWCGASWRPGSPVLMFMSGKGLPLKAAVGWKTFKLCPTSSKSGNEQTCATMPSLVHSNEENYISSSSSIAAAEADKEVEAVEGIGNVQADFQKLFSNLVSDGLDPNEAASKALLLMHEQQQTMKQRRIPQTNTSSLTATNSDFRGSNKNFICFQQGPKFGGTHEDTVPFNDSSFVLPSSLFTLNNEKNDCCIFEIATIEVWVDPDNHCVSGLRCSWRINDKILENTDSPFSSSLFSGLNKDLIGPLHGNKNLQQNQNSSPSTAAAAGSIEGQSNHHLYHKLSLHKNEFIVKMVVRCGALIDCFMVQTNQGRSESFGGFGGSEVIVFDATTTPATGPQECLFAFCGGYGGHLHNLSAVTVKRTLPPVSSTTSIPHHIIYSMIVTHLKLQCKTISLMNAIENMLLSEEEDDDENDDDTKGKVEFKNIFFKLNIVLNSLGIINKYVNNLLKVLKQGVDATKQRSIKLTNVHCDGSILKYSGGCALLMAVSFYQFDFREHLPNQSPPPPPPPPPTPPLLTPVTVTSTSTTTQPNDEKPGTTEDGLGDLYLSSNASGAILEVIAIDLKTTIQLLRSLSASAGNTH